MVFSNQAVWKLCCIPDDLQLLRIATRDTHYRYERIRMESVSTKQNQFIRPVCSRFSPSSKLRLVVRNDRTWGRWIAKVIRDANI